MYKLALLSTRYKVALTIAAAFAMGAMLAPGAMVHAQASDTFGLNPVAEELDSTLGTNDLQGTIAAIINVALSLLGIVSVVIVLMGGFKWMTAGGDAGKVDEARKLIFSGIIGMAIILSAWAISKWVLVSLARATGAPGNIPDDINNQF